MRRSLKATTAIVASLNLAMPAPLLAQTSEGESPALDQGVSQQVMEICADLDVASCVDATGLPQDLVAQAMGAASGGEATAQEPADEPLTETPESQEAEAEGATDAVGEADESAADALSEPSENGEEAIESATEEPTPPPAEVSEDGEETMEAAGEALDESLSESGDADAALEQTDEVGGPDAGTEGEIELAPDANAETGAATSDDEVTGAPLGDQQTDGAATDDGSAMQGDEEPSGMTSEEVQRELEAADPAATGEAPAEEPAVEDAQSPEGEAEDTGAAAPAGKTPVPPETADTATNGDTNETEGSEEEETAGAEDGAEPAGQSAQDGNGADAPDASRGEAGPEMTGAERAAMEGSSDANVAATAEDAAPSGEVARETVTEETARSSGEDFDTAISREAASGADALPEEETSVESDDDSGLSNLQKALLVGAGALAVGTLLNNNREVVASSDDRVVVSGRDGGYELLKDDTALLQRPGTEVATESFDDGSTRTIVTRPDGSQIVTIRDADLRVLQRVRVTPDGERIVLIDDTGETQPVDVASLRPAERPAADAGADREALRQALAAEGTFDRSFSLAQIRNIAEVRQQVPAVELDNITFATGSAAIPSEQAEELTALGRYIGDAIAENPREIFLVEGHTDAVGNAAYNLALSDRRAESVALALTEYFDVPPENLVVQGYGERFLRVETDDEERANRRATLRRITPLLQMAAANP